MHPAGKPGIRAGSAKRKARPRTLGLGPLRRTVVRAVQYPQMEEGPPLRMTQFSNFAIRLLMYAALNGDKPSAVPEVARAYRISYDHLKKAAAELCRRGYLETVRGRNGGFLLARQPVDIRIGEVIRQTEGGTALVECFAPLTNTCPLLDACQLRVALQEAHAAFFAALDRYTLADLVRTPEQLTPLLGIDPLGPARTAHPRRSSPSG